MRVLLFISNVLYRLLLLVIVLLGFFLYSLSTPQGSRVILQAVVKWVPGKLSVEHIDGVVTSDITFKHLVYSSETVDVSIQSLHLNWSPLQLLKKNIAIHALESEGVSITLKPTAPVANKSQTDNTSSVVAWLDALVIDHLSLQQLTINKQDNIVYQADQIELLRHSANYALTVKSGMGDVAGQFSLHATPTLNWKVNVTVSHIIPPPAYAIENSEISFLLASDGQWSNTDKKMQLSLQNISGKLRGFPLQGVIALQWDNGALQIQESTVSIANAMARISGSMNKTWDLQWQLNIPQLNKILPDSRGALSSWGRIGGTQQAPRINANIQASELYLYGMSVSQFTGNLDSRFDAQAVASLDATIKNFRAGDYHLPSSRLVIASSLNNAQWVSQLKLSLSPENVMQGSVTVPAAQWDSQPLSGKIQVQFAKLDALLMGVPEIKKSSGNIQGTVSIDGTVMHPHFAIQLALKDGSTFVPRLGITLKNIALQASYDDNQPVKLAGHFVSGAGTGKINATLDLNQASYPLMFKLEGDNLQLADLNEYKIVVSPDLTLTYDDKIVSIDGSVTIPYADITPTDFSNVLTLPDEAVIVDQVQPESWLPTNVFMNVSVTLGKHIYLAYENLKTTLSGAVKITQDQGSLPKATGELTILNGQYRAYGHLLKIKEGRLIYNGNALTNPGISLRAFKTVKTLTFAGNDTQFSYEDKLNSVYTGTSTMEVGIWVKGTLDNPGVTLYAQPGDISQNDILSYLVFGYPQSKISSASALMLLNDVASDVTGHVKGMEGGMVDKVQDLLGLSELNIGSTEYISPDANKVTGYATGNMTSVSIGKQLGKKFSVHYTVGFFHPVQILSLKYLINKHFSVQSETSTIENGADVMYEVERD